MAFKLLAWAVDQLGGSITLSEIDYMDVVNGQYELEVYQTDTRAYVFKSHSSRRD